MARLARSLLFVAGTTFVAGLHAAEIQIWTDVDGMLTADPRVVDGARPLSSLSFAEASELAYFGAKVLHPSTIAPAVTDGIPVRILNSHRPQAEGTLITSSVPELPPGPAAIACKRGVTRRDAAPPVAGYHQNGREEQSLLPFLFVCPMPDRGNSDVRPLVKALYPVARRGR